MQNGGKRPGAGRKPGSKGGNTKLAEQLKAEFIKEYTKHKKEIWDALFTKAKAGDTQAIKEANERAMGKVPATIDASDSDTEIYQIVIKRKHEAS